jgi:DNA-binding NarL/FixJ family response regulator
LGGEGLRLGEFVGRIAVIVSVENEIFARGLEACFRDDPSFGIADEPADADVGVASPPAVNGHDWPCPVLVCVDGPIDLEEVGRAVVGFLPQRTLHPAQLLPAVRAAAAGLRVGVQVAPTPDFDGRSVEVLRLLADGAGPREISRELGYSERTIKSVIADVTRDLGARTRAQAVAVAMRRALI